MLLTPWYALTACGDPDYYDPYGIGFGVAAILLGLVLCFAGFRLLNASNFIAGLAFAGGLTWFLLIAHEDEIKQNLGQWETLLIALGVGLVAAITVMFLFKLGFFILGLLTGAVIGSVLLALREGGLVQGSVSAWVIVGALALVFGVLALIPIIEFPILVFATSLLGSYGVMAAIDYYANCRRFSVILGQMVSTGDFDIDAVEAGLGTWLLFGGMLLLTMFGIAAQVLGSSPPDNRKYKPVARCCHCWDNRYRGEYDTIP